ncbi:unnamed protein product, partial [Brassica oleracea var. botrytis]
MSLLSSYELKIHQIGFSDGVRRGEFRLQQPQQPVQFCLCCGVELKGLLLPEARRLVSGEGPSFVQRRRQWSYVGACTELLVVVWLSELGGCGSDMSSMAWYTIPLAVTLHLYVLLMFLVQCCALATLLVVLSFVSIAPFDLVSFSSEFNHRAQGRSAQVLLVEARRRMVDSIGSVGEACVVET